MLSVGSIHCLRMLGHHLPFKDRASVQGFMDFHLNCVFASFPTAVIKNKQKPWTKATQGRKSSLLNTVQDYNPTWRGSQEDRSLKQLVSWDPQSRDKEWWMLLAHIGQVFLPSQNNPHRYDQRPVFQVTLDSVKMTVNIDHHRLIKTNSRCV